MEGGATENQAVMLEFGVKGQCHRGHDFAQNVRVDVGPRVGQGLADLVFIN